MTAVAATDAGLVIGVRYLTGYAVAALPTGEPEWPPHPARLFMAMVAACHETGGGGDELAALEWLEQQDAPAVIASDHDTRGTCTVYVPPNDFKDSDPNIIPQWRTRRQPRTFPRTRPHDDVVHFIWPVTPDPQHIKALQQLCSKVTRLGHSSSLVQVWLQDEAVEQGRRQRYQPTLGGTLRLRHINPGTLEYLTGRYREVDIEDHFRLDAQVVSAAASARKNKSKAAEAGIAQAKAAYEQRFGQAWIKGVAPERLRPEMSSSVAYERDTPGRQARHSCFDPAMVVLVLSPADSRYRRLATAAGSRVCDVLRKALVKHAPNDLEVVCGHAADGSPLRTPHMAVVPMPFVGGRHGDGHLLGAAIVLPGQISPADRSAVMGAIHKVKTLTLGDLGTWTLSTVSMDDRRHTLRPETWTATQSRPAACWATVTPISLDRHPKAKDPVEQQDELAGLIRQACQAIDLPQPMRVTPLPISVFNGAPDASRYPRLPRKDGSMRRQTHAILWFDKPIVGPVLLGAGRFRGWGLCRPYQEGVM